MSKGQEHASRHIRKVQRIGDVDEIRVRPNGSSSDVLLANSDWILQSRDVSDCDAAEIQNASIYDYASGTTITGAALGRIAWDKDAQVVFTNKLASVDVQLKKVREDGTTTISGSVFDLHKYGNSWTSVQTAIEPGKAASGTTPAVSNPVDLGELGIGRYRLTETKAPETDEPASVSSLKSNPMPEQNSSSSASRCSRSRSISSQLISPMLRKSRK